MSAQGNTLSQGDTESVRALYQACNHHWAHSEQVRWTLLYNFLMASTILLLAWATVFSSGTSGSSKRLVMVVLCAGGLLVSILWAGLGMRANDFVDMYAALGRKVEESLVSNLPRPFANANEHRFRIHGIARINSRTVLIAVPWGFAVLYAILAVVSLTV